jgi:hypothetical protein
MPSTHSSQRRSCLHSGSRRPYPVARLRRIVYGSLFGFRRGCRCGGSNDESVSNGYCSSYCSSSPASVSHQPLQFHVRVRGSANSSARTETGLSTLSAVVLFELPCCTGKGWMRTYSLRLYGGCAGNQAVKRAAAQVGRMEKGQMRRPTRGSRRCCSAKEPWAGPCPVPTARRPLPKTEAVLTCIV